MKKLISLLAAFGLVAGIAASAQAGKAVTVFEDPAGDADNAQGTGQSIPGGFDLASATIAKNGPNLEFTVFHHDMPPTGTAPEATRFIWAFKVGEESYRLTVKSVDIGKPDVAQGQTTERVGRVDANGHFRLEGECVQDSTLPLAFVNCPPLEYLEGSWDPAAKSFTVIVPLASIKAKVGSVITTGTDPNTAICAATACWVSHYAERSLSTTVIDSASMLTAYKVPKK